MIARSFYIADDEAFGVGTSSFSIVDNESDSENYYDELTELFFQESELELHF